MSDKIRNKFNINGLKRTVRSLLNKTENLYLDCRSAYYLRRLKNKPVHSDRIKVGFIVQMPEVWDKQASVYESMVHDNSFETYIFVLPPYDFESKRIRSFPNDTYAFYKEKYKEQTVLPLHDYSDFKEIKHKYDLEYVFYDRPYNSYFPKKMNSEYVVKYAKICHINYCPNEFKGVFSYNSFARNVYIWFASNSEDYNAFKKFYNHRLKYRNVMSFGYPAYDRYKSAKSDFKTKKILWTPRWSYDSKFGGSHFLEYIEKIIRYFANNKEYSLTIRPHPLMFENFVVQNLLSKQDVITIKKKCQDANITFDNNEMIYDTFKEIDLLISDYSSVISLYMTTKKPVIYCYSELDYNNTFKKLMRGMYVSYSWQEVESILNDLLNGVDVIKSQREQIVDKILLNTPNSVTDIIKKIIDDHNHI